MSRPGVATIIWTPLRITSKASELGTPPIAKHDLRRKTVRNGILLPKLFWPIVRKHCSSDREKLLKYKAEGRELAKFLRSLEQSIQAVKGQNNFW